LGINEKHCGTVKFEGGKFKKTTYPEETGQELASQRGKSGTGLNLRGEAQGETAVGPPETKHRVRHVQPNCKNSHKILQYA